jgi:outer membrane protein OmpA-like peptidoglycan-associated protein
MWRSPEIRASAAAAAALAAGLTAILLPAAPGWAQSEDAVGVVEDLYFVVESLDGTETVERGQTEVTVTLTSDVLFALDESELTAEARDRLAAVADQIRGEGAGGTVTIAGHTDDQGSDSYNQDLSQRRAESVRAELAGRLSDLDVTFETAGYGETEPRVPNVVDGQPNEDNRAKNRRVEITYDVRDGGA